MRFLFRLLPLLVGISSLGTFIVAFLAPRFGLYGAAVGLLAVAYFLFELLGRRTKDRDVWATISLALIFFAASFGFFLYLEGWVSQLLLTVFASALLAIFAEHVYRWFYGKTALPSYAFGVMSAFLEVFLIFFLASDLIGLRIFLRAPVGLLVPGFAVLVAILYVLVRATRRPVRALVPNAALLGLLFGELFWATLFLPTAFLVGGALLAILWYVVSGIVRAAESGAVLRRPVKRYALVASLLAFVVVLSARWV